MSTLSPGERSLTTVDLGSPPAGSNIAKLPEANSRWKVVSIGFTLNATMVGPPRRVDLRIALDGHIWRFTSSVTQPAGAVYIYSFHAGFSFPTGLQGDFLTVYQSLPMWLEGGNMGPISTVVTNLDAGDQFTAAVALVEEGIQL